MPDHAYPAAPAPAVGALVVRGDSVLLVLRGRAPNRRLWALPGGRVELGETLQAAAEREVFEETGVRVRAGEPVFSFDSIVRDESGRIRYHYVIVDLLADYLSGEPAAADDALEARWVDTRELSGMQVSSTTLKLLRSTLDCGAE